MNNLLDVPIASVTALTPERAVLVVRAILRAECGYAKLTPAALTISTRLTIADGGIDAEVKPPVGSTIPTDCIFQDGATGFQIKSGTAFKPWTVSSVRSELVNSKGQLHSEVERIVRRGGRYTLLCTGHDLTPEQRNDSISQIASILDEMGFPGYEEKIQVFGASQLAEFAERYPGTASLMAPDPIQEAWVLEEWQRDAQLANAFEPSSEQSEIIAQIRAGLQGETKHIRVLGETGLGKTRIVLESVKDENIAPYVLYIQHGSLFGQTKLFRQLLKAGYDKPLILVIDELPEFELSDIWRHLKPLCGSLKIVSIDHGRDETHDEEIERLDTPRLPDGIIRKILATQVGDKQELHRWVTICEGSPRVAQAVAENLRANPDDLLKPPSTVPIWLRFLHGYGRRDEASARQVDCVTQHLALFSRFGYEAPVGDEAVYISELIRKIDPTLGWARFQEVILHLRARRVLQGSRTLFFVPRALHIYLWKQFWERYGRAFDFTETFSSMPESLHTWFMNMFKFAGGATTAHVIDDVLRPDGIFAEHALLTSAKGARFLSTLAEANPAAVLRLLEATVGKWTDQELYDFKQDRQSVVWALEKIAVWPAHTVRAIQVLARFAANENANFSNNSTGTLVGLFRIGPEVAATESSPESRLPALVKLLRAPRDVERVLGLKAIESALDSRGRGMRIVGPEYQGLRQKAKLWSPTTYSDWWKAHLIYFQTLIDETRNWPSSLRPEVCLALLNAVEQQIKTPPCTELAFQVLEALINDDAMAPGKLNEFFWHSQEYVDCEKGSIVASRLRGIERRYTRRNMASRFQRYVVDVDWMEWDEHFREMHQKGKTRSKTLVNALARRIARRPEKLNEVQHLLAPAANTPALWHFGDQLGLNDQARTLLMPLTRLALETKHHVCLHAYLTAIRRTDSKLYLSTVTGFVNEKASAWLGVSIALRSEYEDELFVQCLDALEKRWVEPRLFGMLGFGKVIELLPAERVARLFSQLREYGSEEAIFLLVELLDSVPLNDSSPFSSAFVFGAVTKAIPGETGRDVMRGYHWKNVCEKLIKWDRTRALLLLDELLTGMGKVYRLSYDTYAEPLATNLVRTDPAGAWDIVRKHIEESLPKWRSDLFNWLKGGLSTFEGREQRGAIADLPVSEILKWIEVDPGPRSVLMAHAAPRSLDDETGGQLTRELLNRYSGFDGVRSGISATFGSGGWTGRTSDYQKRKRDKFRRWLAAGFEADVTQWIEAEIESLDLKIQREEINEERSRYD
ncbi:hypothetical protein ACO0LO_22280 [Undibacterium sp. TJN25]|uniref:hypothetical protein n=1 Tax=Undibacterium sp. TJN25 TaxID=3413056 RepID=UPI003BF29557